MFSYVEKQCLFCGPDANLQQVYAQSFKDEELNPAVFSARRTTEHYHYNMVKCLNCSLLFSRSVLSENDLNDLYGESAVTFGEYFSVLRRDYWVPIHKFFPKPIGNKVALEIGCSSGFFLEELRQQGFHSVVGVEPSLPAKNAAIKDVQDDIVSGLFTHDLKLPYTEFDLICSFQTLDHVPDPSILVETCASRLREGGYAYFVVHNTEALQARILGEKSPIIDVEHIYLFNPKTLARLMEKSGLKVVEQGALKNSYPIQYWISMFPLPKGLRKVLAKFVQKTGLGKLAMPIYAGNMYIVAQKPFKD